MWNRFRWHLALAISHIGWWVMPEPQKSRCLRDFSDALERIKAREGARRTNPEMSVTGDS